MGIANCGCFATAIQLALLPLAKFQNYFHSEINFIPIRGNFARGIFASVYTKTDLSENELNLLFKNYYKEEPFVFITQKNPSLKQVVNTNKCVLFIKKEGDKVFIISLIDNLIKGASGQAIQNMNLIFGLGETEGLNLKAMVF